MNSIKNNWDIKIFFDGACPICAREMQFLKRRDKIGRLQFENISQPNFDHSIFPNLKNADVIIHGMLPNGEMVSGVEVFRIAYRAVGLGWLLAPTAWPILRLIFDAAYLVFARNRIKIGKLLGRDCGTSCK